LDWTVEQLGIGGNGEMFPEAGSAEASPGLAPDPFGGLSGTMGSYVHTGEEARFGFTGNAVRDVWSNEVEIDVAPLSAVVTAELTMDTRYQPSEVVIKITVTDPATGTEAVYFLHDYADAEIKINVPEASQVTDNTGGQVSIGKFRNNDGAETEGKPSTPPDEIDGAEAVYNTQPNVELYANGDDEVNTHLITAPGEVIIHGSSYADSVTVRKRSDGKYEILVYQNGVETGADVVVETYIVDGASKITLDFLPEKITGSAADDPIVFKGVGDHADSSNADAAAVAEQLTELQGINLSAEEIQQKAAEQGIDLNLPPAVPNASLFNLLAEIDPVLANLLRAYRDSTNEQREVLYTQIRDRLVALLQILYPQAGVAAVAGEGRDRDDILFGGQEIDILIATDQIGSGQGLGDLLQFDA
jgi:hypothetical protein